MIHLTGKLKSVVSFDKLKFVVLSEFIKQKRVAFQILFAKFRNDSTRSSRHAKSTPVADPASVIRVASTPYFSNTSSGSIPLFFVFDIRWPCLSSTVP